MKALKVVTKVLGAGEGRRRTATAGVPSPGVVPSEHLVSVRMADEDRKGTADGAVGRAGGRGDGGGSPAGGV